METDQTEETEEVDGTAVAAETEVTTDTAKEISEGGAATAESTWQEGIGTEDPTATGPTPVTDTAAEIVMPTKVTETEDQEEGADHPSTTSTPSTQRETEGATAAKGVTTSMSPKQVAITGEALADLPPTAHTQRREAQTTRKIK